MIYNKILNKLKTLNLSANLSASKMLINKFKRLASIFIPSVIIAAALFVLPVAASSASTAATADTIMPLLI